jgi:hypothetical protein
MFIKLHRADGRTKLSKFSSDKEREVRINPLHIVSFKWVEDHDEYVPHTYVSLTGDDFYRVNETPEEIESKSIKVLTNAS